MGREYRTLLYRVLSVAESHVLRMPIISLIKVLVVIEIHFLQDRVKISMPIKMSIFMGHPYATRDIPTNIVNHMPRQYHHAHRVGEWVEICNHI